MRRLCEYRLIDWDDMNIVILPELRDYIEPLQVGEYEALEQSILAENCRDSLIVWEIEPDEYVLVDGHNRFDICKKHHIRFNISVYDFKNLDDVKDWMLENQLSRRNLTDAQRDYYLGKLYAKAKQAHGGDRKSKVHSELLKSPEEVLNEAQSAVEALAEKENVSISTLKRNEEFAEAVDAITAEAPELKAKILKSNLPKRAVVELAKSDNLPKIQEEVKADASKFVEGLKTFKHLKKNDDEPRAIETPLVVKIASVEDLEKADNQATKESLLSQFVKLEKEIDLQKRLRDDQAKNTKEYMDLASERFHKIKELEAQLQKKDIFINGKIDFTEADLMNPELQAEYFGLYSEMPVSTQNTYVGIPKNQYYYFRSFINMVCDQRPQYIEDMKNLIDQNNELIDKLKKKTQIPDNQYFVQINYFLSAKNKLHEAIDAYLRPYHCNLLVDISGFVATVEKGIEELNQKFPRCRPEKIRYNQTEVDKYTEFTGYLTVGDTFGMYIKKCKVYEPAE